MEDLYKNKKTKTEITITKTTRKAAAESTTTTTTSLLFHKTLYAENNTHPPLGLRTKGYEGRKIYHNYKRTITAGVSTT